MVRISEEENGRKITVVGDDGSEDTYKVQKVYRDQGVPIHDKHIELIVRQMLRLPPAEVDESS